MGRFRTGDVLLAKVAIGNVTPMKLRPAVVVGIQNDGLLRICPFSSQPPSDSESLEVDIYDFAEGGLDLFDASYVLTAETSSLSPGNVIAKKGHLHRDVCEKIVSMAASTMNP